MNNGLGRVIIYTNKMPEMVAFYTRHFDFDVLEKTGDRIVELVPRGGGAAILLHGTGAGRKTGQTLVKLVFDIRDVPGFCEAAALQGLEFGPIHQADGYCFANAKDPGGNPVSVSSRAFAD